MPLVPALIAIAITAHKMVGIAMANVTELLIVWNLFFFFNVYLFLRQRETEHEWGRGRERGRHTESEAGSRL